MTNVLADASVDYGTLGPEDLDRFGTKQEYQVWMRGDPYDTRMHLVTMAPDNVIRRIGLFLHGWYRNRYHGAERYCMTVNDRPVEIRSYADGRIKIFLDDQPVYAENVKTITRHGIKHREVAKYFDPAPDDEDRYQEREAVKEAVRQRLKERHGR